MPCVFPILALKALHLSRVGRRRAQGARAMRWLIPPARSSAPARSARRLLAIRAAGAEAGWAFQLQDPRTIMLLLLLATAITANLLGLFELPVLGGRARPAGSFGTGALAAFVATPCAGPFLGAALGTALLLPAAGSVLVFAALGLGLALPFLVDRVRSGASRQAAEARPWMERLQRFLAIPMAATRRRLPVAALAAGGEHGAGGRSCRRRGACDPAGLVRLRAAARGARRRRRSLALAIARRRSSAHVARVPAHPRAAHSVAGAEPWSEARGGALRWPRGKPVFVYFTADWCLTCKANEAAAIDRDEVRDAFKAGGRQSARRRLDQWRSGDHPLPRKPGPRRGAALPVVRARQAARGAAADPDAVDAHFPRSVGEALGARSPHLLSRRPTSPAPASAPAPAHRPRSGRGRRG